jgi:hypothetical protein
MRIEGRLSKSAAFSVVVVERWEPERGRPVKVPFWGGHCCGGEFDDEGTVRWSCCIVPNFSSQFRIYE